ncbi:MAG: type II toxin-antitoxin system VapC family toxin [Xanthobacteraceae bacterium]|nr:type II toxin-antitoxin system VapC family toxin [Xanthobacteraceae bacterium]
MRGWLLDTNVLSELRKPKPNAKVVEFVAAQPGELLFTTEVTFGEIRFGIEQLEDPGRRADIHLWLDRRLRPLFAGRVLTITEDVVLRWKTMAVEGQRRGHTFGQPDLFIAAIAALEDLAVVTRDVGEFVVARVPAFNPWSSTLHAGGVEISIKAPASIELVASALTDRRR